MSTATTTETRPCWILTYPNGDPVDPDGEPHFATEKLAADSVERYTELDEGVPVSKQLKAPCVTISCSCCEETFDEDGEGRIEHHPSIETIHSVVKDCGWIVYEDGSATCEPCSGQCDCGDKCSAVSPHGDVCVRPKHDGMCRSVGRKRVSSPEKADKPWFWYRDAASAPASAPTSVPAPVGAPATPPVPR